jgi:threonine synthase
MNYYSTNKTSPLANFRQATIQGQAPDKGLYFPEHIPHLTETFLNSYKQMSKEAVAYQVIAPYVGDSIPSGILEEIVSKTIDFDFPLVKVNDNIASLELFHGPTLAFKDVGAGFMSRCLGYFAQTMHKEITVLVATSGDTGGAVAAGFAGVEGVNVVILYPSGKVSKVQEQQLTTWGRNIHALEVKGNFDDCQQMVKQAFADTTLTDKHFLTSANSINVARWLPQQMYYFFAMKQWHHDTAPVVSVPSGNFGNICAGILAHASGLPIGHFLAACNANRVVPDYFTTGNYQPKKAVATISNAMDVGNPSNFVRILEIFHNEFNPLTSLVDGYSISDDDTRATMQRVWTTEKYMLDPHGAVGYLSLERYLTEHPDLKGLFLETAHPVKFYDVVEPILGTAVPLPEAVKGIMNKEKISTVIEPEYEALRVFLMER